MKTTRPRGAEVGEALDVRVLDAPRMRRRREGLRRLVESSARVREKRAVGEFVVRALPPDAEQWVREEDPPADVGQHRSLAIALDVLGGAARPMLEAEKLEAVRDGLAAHREQADRDGAEHAGDRKHTSAIRTHDDHDQRHGQDLADEGVECAGHDHADRAGDARCPCGAAFAGRCRPSCQQEECERKCCGGERGEVVVADERGLAGAGRRVLEVAQRPDDLEEPDGGDDAAPGDQGSGPQAKAAQVVCDQHERRREQHVLEPLRRSDGVGSCRIRVEAERAPGRCQHDECRERGPGDPDRPCAAQPVEPVLRRRDRGDDDRQDRDVGEVRMCRRPTETDGE